MAGWERWGSAEGAGVELGGLVDGEPVLEADESDWLPIVPSLGLVWRF